MSKTFLGPKHFLSAVKQRGITSISQSIKYASLANVIALVMGPITAFLIVTQFSPELQGFYYTFGSLISVRFLGELGLGQTIIQFASHEWTHLKLTPSGEIEGDPASHGRLYSLVRISTVWYAVMAVVLIIGLALIGPLLFSTSDNTTTDWQWPWFGLCVATGVSFMLIPLFSLLQGCGYTDDYWLYRLIVQIVGGVSLWTAILFGYELWSGFFSVLCTTTVGIIFLILRHSQWIKALFIQPQAKASLNWRQDIWPIQWRIAIVWLTSTFLVQMFTPMVFHTEGPIVAGKVGLTITLSMVLYALISNWLVTKGPMFGRLIAQNQFVELDRLFSYSLVMSIVTAVIGVLGGTSIVLLSHTLHIPLSQRLLAPIPTALFLLGSSVAALTAGFGVYLRAHKQEPLVVVYSITSLVGLAVCFLSLKLEGVTGLSLAYFSVLITCQLPWVLFVFQKSRRIWHKASA